MLFGNTVVKTHPALMLLLLWEQSGWSVAKAH
jgi:hypothetical protein